MTYTKEPAVVGRILDTFWETISGGNPGFKTIAKGLSIQTIWSKTVGVNIAKRTRPLKLKGKTLYVTVATSTWMEELKYMKEDIIKKINTELRKKAVKDIIFRLGKVTEISTSNPKPASPKADRSAKGGPQRSHQLTQKEIDNIDTLVSLIKDNELKETIRRALITSKCRDTHPTAGHHEYSLASAKPSNEQKYPPHR